MGNITINIDGRSVSCQENETILTVARSNDIFIPAICMLERCSPTLACRICLVEADGKQVFACNAKTKDGMQIVTNSEEVKQERRAIMEIYDINHPLECGVCDKSGSCELQNYTMEMGVDCQTMATPDVPRPIKDWGLVKYDASLCIVCERCVTSCKDMVGDAALGTVSRGAPEIDKSYKETVPKNAYTIWTRMNKNIIGTKSGNPDSLDCTYCGECIAVCPVGALTTPAFTYKSNAWELEKIPSSCAHCASGCHLYYEVKHASIDDASQKIYRVTNEWNFSSLCGAGRFGFDFENRAKKDQKAFDAAVEALKNAKTVKIDGRITNEEALIWQRLKQKMGYKLISPTAKALQNFLTSFAAEDGESYNATTKVVHDSNFVVSVGMKIVDSAPMVRFAMNNAMTMNKGAGLYFHPLEDKTVNGLSKNLSSFAHKVGAEESVMALLLWRFANKEALPQALRESLASQETTIVKTVVEKVKEKIEEVVKEKVANEDGTESEVEKTVQKEVEKSVEKQIEVATTKLFEVVGLPLDSIEKIDTLFAKKDACVLLLGSDLLTHPKAANIARLAGLLQKHSNFKVLIVPEQTNDLGVALICDLDEKAEGFSVGYNREDADFIITSLGSKSRSNALDIPALNQQEGTITTLDKQVVPLNAALVFDGYELNDIANAFGIGKKLTVDFTRELPTSKGFRAVNFDDLPCRFENNGEAKRGYALENITFGSHAQALQPIESVEEYNGTIVYLCDPVLQFSPWTAKCEQLATAGITTLSCSKAFMDGHGIAADDRVSVSIDGLNLPAKVVRDDKNLSNIATLSVCDLDARQRASLESKYRFQKATLQKG